VRRNPVATLDRRKLLTGMASLACTGIFTGSSAASRVRVVATGLLAPESPKPLADGSVLVVEMMRGTLSRVRPDGKIVVVASLGGSPTGVAIGPDGHAYVMNNSAAQFRREGALTVWVGESAHPEMAPSIQVVELNSGAHRTLFQASEQIPLVVPNDLVFDRNDGFYFTDTGGVSRSAESGAVYWAKADGSVIRRIADVPSANGVVLSPDYRRLFVASTQTVMAFDVIGAGRLATDATGTALGRLFASIPTGRLDSMAEEADGGLVIGTIMPGQLTSFDRHGKLRGTLPLPPEKAVTSVGFGGSHLRTAYATLTQTGTLVAIDWPRPGLRLSYQ
jgi:gluconolactonase